MRLNWGWIWIIIATFLAVITVYIGLNPNLDTSFEAIWIYNQPLLRAHHFFEMPEMFFFGLGFSRIFKSDVSPRLKEALRKVDKVFPLVIFFSYMVGSVYLSVELSHPLLNSLFTSLLIGFPFLVGYTLHSIYFEGRQKKAVSTGLYR